MIFMNENQTGHFPNENEVERSGIQEKGHAEIK